VRAAAVIDQHEAASSSSSGNHRSHKAYWSSVAGDATFIFVAMRYVYVAARVYRSTRPESVSNSAALKWAIYAFMGMQSCAV
jgi:hypothetical protein